MDPQWGSGWGSVGIHHDWDYVIGGDPVGVSDLAESSVDVAGGSVDEGSRVNTKAIATRLTVQLPFRAETVDAEQVVRTLAGARNVDVGPVSVAAPRDGCQVGTVLVTVPDGWTTSDRDALGNEVIRALTTMGRQPWVDYQAATAFARVGTEITRIRAAGADEAFVQDLDGMFTLGERASSEADFTSAVRDMWRRVSNPETELGKNLQRTGVQLVLQTLLQTLMHR